MQRMKQAVTITCADLAAVGCWDTARCSDHWHQRGQLVEVSALRHPSARFPRGRVRARVHTSLCCMSVKTLATWTPAEWAAAARIARQRQRSTRSHLAS